MRDVVVIGGGVIGLTIAWQLAREGASVTVVDDRPASGASWVAAGMLAPAAEARFGEESLFRLNLRAAARYPSFVADLEAEVSEAVGTVGFCRSGIMTVASTKDDAAILQELFALQHRSGLATAWLSPSSCRQLESRLAPGVAGGVISPDDHHIDNRRLLGALIHACTARSVRFVHARVDHIDVERDRVVACRAASDFLHADSFVLAAGVGAASLPGIPAHLLPDVRPVKGEILRLRAPLGAPFVSRPVRGVVRGSDVYIVPRETGEIVVGATTLELGFDCRVSAGGVHCLLDDARRLFPEIDELRFEESVAGLRPATLDGAPVIGPCKVENLLLAYGHYRHGILLAPITADIIAAKLQNRPIDVDMTTIAADRFAHAQDEERNETACESS